MGVNRVELKIKPNTHVIVKIGDIPFKSIVQENKDGEIVISHPMENCRYIKIKENEKITLEVQCRNYLILIKTKILEVYKEKRLKLIKLSVPDEIEKFQRRKDVRIFLVEKIRYINGDEYKECSLIDLSGGGMKIKSKEVFKIGTELNFQLPINEKFELICGKVIRNDIAYDGRNYYGIEFKNLEFTTKERIIQKVFDVLRKELKTKY